MPGLHITLVHVSTYEVPERMALSQFVASVYDTTGLLFFTYDAIPFEKCVIIQY